MDDDLNVPLYVHDCERCTYLGRYLLPEYDKEYDLYICVKESGTNEYVARSSDLGPDYASARHREGGLHHHPALWEAYRRALTHLDRTIRTSARTTH